MKKSGQLVYTVPHDYVSQASEAYNTLKTLRGGQYQIILPDGSHAWLNSSSSLSYPVSFSSTERKVKLLGEGYFEITKRQTSSIYSADRRTGNRRMVES